MKDYSVTITARGGRAGPGLSADTADLLVDKLTELTGVASAVSSTRRTYTAALTVEADTAAKATALALRHFAKATATVGAPGWEIVGVEALDAREAERRAAETRPPPLLDLAGVASELGISRPRAQKLTSSDEFPDPWIAISGAPAWNAHAVRVWKARQVQ